MVTARSEIRKLERSIPISVMGQRQLQGATLKILMTYLRITVGVTV